VSDDSVADISPIILIGTTPLLVAAHHAAGQEHQGFHRHESNPGKLNRHCGSDLAQLAENLRWRPTQFTTFPQSWPARDRHAGGEDNEYQQLAPAIPHVKAGRLRAIAVTTPKRSRALPDVPTIADTVPGYEVIHWYGMWGPKGLPKDIVMRWNQEVARIIRTDAMQKWLEREGMEAAGGPPEEFLNRVKSDVEKWKNVVKQAKIVIAQ
jgi:hypothetical protein